jgi:DNA-binding NarL/FixJ family response regulator
MQRSTQRLRPDPLGSSQNVVTFTPSIVTNRGAQPGPAGTRGANEPETALRVLLVEDSPLLVQRIVELVGDLPQVRLAGTVASEGEALARVDRGDIDVVILDLQLHTGSGFGVLRGLQQRPAAPRVVVFTNFAITAYRDSALALGASHFLDKSRDYERLPSVLRELSEAAH